MLSYHSVDKRFLRSMKRRADNLMTWKPGGELCAWSIWRGKTFDPAENDNFLEVKGVIVQELEVILASGECTSPGTG